jgi:hypothetical protein
MTLIQVFAWIVMIFCLGVIFYYLYSLCGVLDYMRNQKVKK